MNAPDRVECYCCEREFSKLSGMVDHLESGACASGVDVLDVNRQVAECYQWRSFILNDDWREDMLDEEVLDFSQFPFYCLCCGYDFSKLSALFQHIESSACGMNENHVKIKKLTYWLGRSL